MNACISIVNEISNINVAAEAALRLLVLFFCHTSTVNISRMGKDYARPITFAAYHMYCSEVVNLRTGQTILFE